MNRIQTTVVGSYPVPTWLRVFIDGRDVTFHKARIHRSCKDGIEWK